MKTQLFAIGVATVFAVSASAHAQVTYARATKKVLDAAVAVNGQPIPQVFDRDLGRLVKACQWTVEVGEVYIFEGYYQDRWDAHFNPKRVNTFESLLNMDNVQVRVPTAGLVFIQSSSSEYAAAKQTYILQVAQKQEMEAKDAALRAQRARDGVQRDILGELRRLRELQEQRP